MHEDDLRALIRDAVARHLGQTPPVSGGPGSMLAGDGRIAPGDGRAGCPNPALPLWSRHLSHGRFVFLAPTDPDAPCIVEPHVRCHHCGFCQSYGH